MVTGSESSLSCAAPELSVSGLFHEPVSVSGFVGLFSLLFWLDSCPFMLFGGVGGDIGNVNFDLQESLAPGRPKLSPEQARPQGKFWSIFFGDLFRRPGGPVGTACG